MGFFDAVGDVVGGAVDAVTDVVDDAGSVATSALGSTIGDTFEAFTANLGPIGDVVDGAVDVLSSGGLGDMLDKGLDALGMPDWIGDIGGGVLDFCTGNYVGVVQNGLDALEDVAGACGGDEIAGFLKAGSQVTGMFSGEAPVGLGQVDDLIDASPASMAAIDEALGGVQSLANGDLVGAGEGLLDTFGGGLGPLAPTLGELSDEASRALDGVIVQANSSLGPVANLVADLDSSDAFADLGNTPSLANLDDRLTRGCAGFFDASAADGGGVFSPSGGPADPLLDAVNEMLTARLGADHPDVDKLAAKADFTDRIFQMGLSGSGALDILHDLLGESPVDDNVIDTIPRHGSSLRA